MANPFAQQDLSPRREAALALQQQAKASREAQTAGGVQLGGTLLGALIGTIATGGNPAGAAAGAAIGSGLASAASPVIAPQSAPSGAAAAGVTQGLQGTDRLMELIKQFRKEQAGAEQVRL